MLTRNHNCSSCGHCNISCSKLIFCGESISSNWFLPTEWDWYGSSVKINLWHFPEDSWRMYADCKYCLHFWVVASDPTWIPKFSSSQNKQGNGQYLLLSASAGMLMDPFVKSSICRSRECLFTHIIATGPTLDILYYFLWFASEVRPFF